MAHLFLPKDVRKDNKGIYYVISDNSNNFI